MRGIKILIVEDKIVQAVKIRTCLIKLGHEDIEIAGSIPEARAIFEEQMMDLLIMDINLEGEIDGIELVEEIRKRHPVPVIYITSISDRETLERAQKTLPQAYLIKPINLQNLKKLQYAIELSLYRFANEEDSNSDNIPFNWKQDLLIGDSFFVKLGNQLRKVKTAEIEYFQVANDNNCDIITKGHKFSLRTSLSGLMNKLPKDNFIRIHRAYLINLEFLEAINEREYTLKISGHDLPIGKTYRKDLLNKIDYLR